MTGLLQCCRWLGRRTGECSRLRGGEEVAGCAQAPAPGATGTAPCAGTNCGPATAGCACPTPDPPPSPRPQQTALGPAARSRWVAAAVEGRDDEVLLLRVDWEARALRETGWCRLEGLHMPSQLAFGPGNRRVACARVACRDSI